MSIRLTVDLPSHPRLCFWGRAVVCSRYRSLTLGILRLGGDSHNLQVAPNFRLFSLVDIARPVVPREESSWSCIAAAVESYRRRRYVIIQASASRLHTRFGHGGICLVDKLR